MIEYVDWPRVWRVQIHTFPLTTAPHLYTQMNSVFVSFDFFSSLFAYCFGPSNSLCVYFCLQNFIMGTWLLAKGRQWYEMFLRPSRKRLQEFKNIYFQIRVIGQQQKVMKKGKVQRKKRRGFYLILKSPSIAHNEKWKINISKIFSLLFYEM